MLDDVDVGACSEDFAGTDVDGTEAVGAVAGRAALGAGVTAAGTVFCCCCCCCCCCCRFLSASICFLYRSMTSLSSSSLFLIASARSASTCRVCAARNDAIRDAYDSLDDAADGDDALTMADLGGSGGGDEVGGRGAGRVCIERDVDDDDGRAGSAPLLLHELVACCLLLESFSPSFIHFFNASIHFSASVRLSAVSSKTRAMECRNRLNRTPASDPFGAFGEVICTADAKDEDEDDDGVEG